MGSKRTLIFLGQGSVFPVQDNSANALLPPLQGKQLAAICSSPGKHSAATNADTATIKQRFNRVPCGQRWNLADSETTQETSVKSTTIPSILDERASKKSKYGDNSLLQFFLNYSHLTSAVDQQPDPVVQVPEGDLIYRTQSWMDEEALSYFYCLERELLIAQKT